MTTSQATRLGQIADIVATQEGITYPEGARPEGLERLAYVLEKAAGITPKGGRTPLGRILDCFYSGKVTVNATGEAPASIAVKTMPTKTSYFVGDALDTTGLVVTVTYVTGDTEDLTTGFTVSPTTLSTAGTQAITVSFTKYGTTVTCTFNVTVAVDVPASLAISGTLTEPQVVSTAPDITGLTATVTYASGKTADVTEDVEVSPETYEATAGEATLTLSYTEDETTVSDSITVTVVEAQE